MSNIAEKYAAQWLPNGEVSLVELIQAAVDEAVESRRHEVAMHAVQQIKAEIGQSVPVVGEPVECLMCGGSGDSRQPQCCGQRESDGACCGYPDPEMCYQCEGTGVIYRKSVKPIPAAELATLREKAARLEQVEKERDEAYAIIDQCQVVSTRCKRYMDERETAQKNAQRYRWLREHWFTMTSVYGNNGTVKFQINQTRYSTATESTLDAAIDAAIAQGKGE